MKNICVEIRQRSHRPDWRNLSYPVSYHAIQDATQFGSMRQQIWNLLEVAKGIDGTRITVMSSFPVTSCDAAAGALTRRLMRPSSENGCLESGNIQMRQSGRLCRGAAK